MRPAAKVAMSGICTALSVLLLFFGVVCCLYYTRRYLRPVMRDIELLKKADCGGARAHFRLRHSVDHLCVYGAAQLLFGAGQGVYVDVCALFRLLYHRAPVDRAAAASVGGAGCRVPAV